MKLVAICSKNESLLFSLAGIETIISDDKEFIIDSIKKIRKSKKYGILIITPKISKIANQIITELRFSRDLPLVVEVPSANIEDNKNIVKLEDFIRTTIGIRI